MNKLAPKKSAQAIVTEMRAANARRWRRNGLTKFGTRQDAIRCLLQDLRDQDVDRPTAVRRVRAWLGTKHHGKSRDYNDSPMRALAFVNDAAAWLWPHGA